MRNLKYNPIVNGEIEGAHIGVTPNNHGYVLPYKYDADAPGPDNTSAAKMYDFLSFIHLDKEGNYTPGITDEQLLEILIHRTEYFQTTVPCEENEVTLKHLRAALQAKNDRTAKRQAQNVEGTYEKH